MRVHRRSLLILLGMLILCPAVMAHEDPDQAIVMLDHRLTIRPDPDDLVARGELHRLAGHWDAALRDYRDAARLGADPNTLACGRSALRLAQGRPQEALELLEGLPEDSETLRLRFRVLDALQRPEEALSALDRSVALDPRPRPDRYLERNRWASAHDLVTPEVALQVLDEGLARIGPDPALVLAAVDLDLALGDPDRAVARLDAAAEASGSPIPLRLRQAEILLGQGRPAAARDAIRNAQEILGRLPVSRRNTPLLVELELRLENALSRAGLDTAHATHHEGGGDADVDILAFVPARVSGDYVPAVEVHPTSAGGTDLVWIAESIASSPDSVTRGPYLQVAGPNRMTVRWRSSGAASSRVSYGPHPDSLDTSVSDPTLTTEHEVVLTGLAPDTRYYYGVGTESALVEGGTPDYTFRTPPLPGTRQPVRAWLLGDSGTANANAEAVRDAYTTFAGTQRPDLWIMLGDNAYSAGTDAEYQNAVFMMYPDMLRSVCLWPTRGNHDGTYTGANNDYYDIFTLPTQAEAGGVASMSEAYYSFDHGNVHFICLDSQGSDRSPAGAMLTWLQSDLVATTQDWIVAFWHHPPYTKGTHDSDNVADSGGRMRDMRENALPILEAGGVDVVFGGHSHAYERSYLIDGHYDISDSLKSSMILDLGDGDPAGDGPYAKPTLGPGQHEGAVYVVAGSSGQNGGGPLNHPVMVTNLNLLGSVVLDVEGSQLDARFLDGNGVIRDTFSIVKGVTSTPETPSPTPGLASYPNPFQALTRIAFRVPEAGPVSIRIYDVRGRLVRTVADAVFPAGPGSVLWDGRDTQGQRVAPGVYFGRLIVGETVSTRRLVLRP